MRYLLLLTTMILAFNLSAQEGEERGKRGEKIEQQRIAFLTTELDLSVEEAQNFWPLYNDYQKRKDEIGLDKGSDKNFEDLNEEESSLMLSKIMDSKRRFLDLESEFMKNLENVLPAKKRLTLLRSEREFKMSVLKRYKKRMKRGEKMSDKKEKKEKLK